MDTPPPFCYTAAMRSRFLLSLAALAAALPARAAPAGGKYAMIDARLDDLSAYVGQVKGCFDSLKAMKASIAAQERLLSSERGLSPAGRLSILEVKRRRALAQHKNCASMAKSGDQRFSEVWAMLAGFEPSDDPGLKPRAKRRDDLRRALNAALGGIGKVPGAKPAEPGS